MKALIAISLGLCAAFMNTLHANGQQLKLPSLIPFKQQQKTVEPIPLTDSRPKSFLQLPKFSLFPSKPANEQTVLEKIQMDSQTFFRNTGENMTNLFEQSNQALRMKTEQTWSFLNQTFPRPAWWAPKPEQPQLVRPPTRSALEQNRRPSVRF